VPFYLFRGAFGDAAGERRPSDATHIKRVPKCLIRCRLGNDLGDTGGDALMDSGSHQPPEDDLSRTAIEPILAEIKHLASVSLITNLNFVKRTASFSLICDLCAKQGAHWIAGTA
jgi:hypothetical protein